MAVDENEMKSQAAATDTEPVEDAELATEDPLGDVLNMQAEIDSLRAEKNAFMEKLARVQADFANSRRRLEAEFGQRLDYANEDLIKSLLPTLDNFDRALQQDPSKASSADILKGISMVSEGLRGSLTKFGTEEIAPKPGDAFEPDRHQAVMQQASEHPEGSVTLLLQKGYIMKGRVLRPAQVAVSAAK